jgi:nitrous oxidase accessory protein NosD/tetratricopeptide (TPR) repeat protein
VAIHGLFAALLVAFPVCSRGQELAEILPRWFRKLDLFAVDVSKDTTLGRDLGFEQRMGYFVAGVGAGGAAQRVGVRRGDIIVGMDFKLEDAGSRGTIRVIRRKQLTDLAFTVPKDPLPFPPEISQELGSRVAPATLVVDQQGKGQYRTITAALGVAAPGDVVEIRDGIYRESLVVPSGVTLRGVGPGSVRVESAKPFIIFGGRGASIRQVTGHGKDFAIEICHGGQLSLVDCTLSATAGDALIADRVDGLRVQNCRLTSKEIGIRLERCKAQVIDSFIANCRWAVAMQRQSDMVATGNTLDRNATGLLVDDSQLTAVNNSISGVSPASGTGVAADRSQITLRGNVIKMFRIGCEGRELRGDIQENTVFQNGYGVRLRAGRLNITGNSFLMNSTAAIALARHVYPGEMPLPDSPLSAHIAHNTISANASYGISLIDRADVDIRQNLIEGNGSGIEVKDATARIANNTIVLQKVLGIDLATKSASKVHNNIVAFNRWGLVVDVQAQSERGFNNVFGNSANLTFPLADGDYVRCDRVSLSDGRKVLTHIYPADDLRAESDFRVDPRFVGIGRDYRLTTSSLLATRKGQDGQPLGAFAVAADPAPVANNTPPTAPTANQTAADAWAKPETWKSAIEFRDTFRPDSEELVKSEYVPVRWNAGDRQLVYGRLALLAKSATGLLQRAAADGPVSLYRIDVATARQATGAYRRVAINQSALPRLEYDWLTRILAHEWTHAADPYGRVSMDAEWRTLVEPRIAAARELLKKRGFTPAAAAQMPVGPQRTSLESAIRQEAGLPSAYTAHNIEESVAEIVSFMLDPTADYSPPPEISSFLRQRLLEPLPLPLAVDPAETAYRDGLRLAARDDHVGAIRAFSETIRLSPRFAFAYRDRAIARAKMNAYADAAADFSQAIAIVSPYSRELPFLQAERQSCEMKATRR